MIPIFEQGNGRGIGYGLISFLERFETICDEHQQNKRAKSFAFILYDFNDKAFKKVLKDRGVYTKLDRLSGNNLSIFYLHSGQEDNVYQFNNELVSRIGLDTTINFPCVVFFKLKKGKFKDISIAQLDNANLVHGFMELYEIIEVYIAKEKELPNLSFKSLKWIISPSKFVSAEVVKNAIRTAFANIF